MKYYVLQDGERIELGNKGEVIRFACCDCGLVHQIAFAIENNGNIGIAVKRDNRSTGQKRRWMPNNALAGDAQSRAPEAERSPAVKHIVP
jgi:uncharacterized Zn finger protein